MLDAAQRPLTCDDFYTAPIEAKEDLFLNKPGVRYCHMLKIGCRIERCQSEIACGTFDTSGTARTR